MNNYIAYISTSYDPTTHSGTVGIVIVNGEDIKEITRHYSETTNSRLYQLGLIQLLHELQTVKSFTVFAPSEYLVNTMNKRFKLKSNYDLWEEVQRRGKGKEVSCKYPANNTIYLKRAKRIARRAWKQVVYPDINTFSRNDNTFYRLNTYIEF